ncbi:MULTISPECIES: YetF domain-containing protein [Paracoccus]|uniref:DUF421 domain-containing protein n=1 Tax=Paracoccus TaxID=265 RepID=UPI00086C2FCF|nr:MULTISPECIES: YetF domain-containing protein [Paracoccus]ODT57756.1 MAG: hypothetical protein ABS73_15700 [Paracoccus sp. SCN 68-21]
MPDPILFDSWPSLIRIPLVGLLAYAALILMLRVSGKRTLSKMNAFDLIVTVALGSTLSTVLLDDGIPLAEGVAALALLICLQYAITWASVRSPRFQGLIKAEPALLVHRGRYLPDAMRRQRVTRDEVQAALRQSGQSDIDAVLWVMLETDGSMTVVPR